MNQQEILDYIIKEIPFHNKIDEFTDRFSYDMINYDLKTFSKQSFIQSMHLTCCLFPKCNQYERMKNMALANLIGFHFDDAVARSVINKETAYDYDKSENIFITENRFVFNLMSSMSNLVFERFKIQYNFWRDGTAFVINKKNVNEKIFTVEDYIIWRYCDFGYQLLLCLLPYSLGYDNGIQLDLEFSLKSMEYNHYCYLLVLMFNDLFSIEKEMEEAFPSNILLLSSGNRNKNIESIIKFIIQIKEKLDLYKNLLIKEFPHYEDIIIGQYYYSHGVNNFYKITERYNAKKLCYKIPI